jgi:Amt family ammonium transporter
VYDPIACWTWNSRGWAKQKGVLDFAGGTVVHINAGCTSLALSLFLKNRPGFGTERVSYPPHNTTYIVLGTVMMWFGWFGFNGGVCGRSFETDVILTSYLIGSAFGANLRAAQACFVTTLSASIGGLAWMILVCHLADPFRSPLLTML